MSANEVLKFRNYRLFLFARLFFILGMQMQSVIVSWQVYKYTKDSLALGLIGLAEAIPYLSLALVGGQLADRIDRKKIIILSLISYMLCLVGLLLLSVNYATIYNHYGVYPIYIIIFITGIARGFFSPAQAAFMAQLVPKHLYPQSASWNSTVWHIAVIIGPAIGGLIYGFSDSELFSYGVALFFAMIGFVFYTFIEKQEMPSKMPENQSFGTQIMDAVRFVFNHQILLGALALDMFAVLFGGVVAVLPVFADEILKLGAEGLGVLRAAPAAGAVLTSGIVSFFPIYKNAGKKLIWSVIGFGLSILGFALSGNLYFSIIMLVLTGVFDSISVIIRSTILQLYTPDEMRGRVSAINGIFIGSSNEIGSFESGLAAKLMGLVPSVVFGASMTLLVSIITARFAPKLRNLEIEK